MIEQQNNNSDGADRGERPHLRRYSVSDCDNGFFVRTRPHPYEEEGAEPWLIELARLYRPYRGPVTVTCDGLSWRVEPDNFTEFRGAGPLMLVDYYALVDRIARALMVGWTPPERDDEHTDSGPPIIRPCRKIKEWAYGRTAASINRMVHERWKELVGKVDPTAVQVQKRVFAAAFGYGTVQLVLRPDFYRCEHVVRDVIRHRAAATAVLLADRWTCSTDEAMGAMSDWKALYSPTGKSYRSLNRTLMNLPGGMSPKLLAGLRRFILPRCITSRLELTATILASHPSVAHPHLRVVSFAAEQDLRQALGLVATHLGRPLSGRKWRDVRDFLQFLADDPEPHRGNVVSLARRSIRFHRQGLRDAAERVLARLGHETEVARPPIALPEEPGIRFLGTVGQLVQDGVDMENCIATYAERATRGLSYLFRVDRDGERANVEVDWCGHVVQASGPKNRPNEAATWGSAVLGRWGRVLRRAARSSASAGVCQVRDIG